MPKWNGQPTRAEKRAARRAAFHAGRSAAPVRHVREARPRSAGSQISSEIAFFQANYQKLEDMCSDEGPDYWGSNSDPVVRQMRAIGKKHGRKGDWGAAELFWDYVSSQRAE